MIESNGYPYKLETPIVGRLSLREDPSLAGFPLISNVTNYSNLKVSDKFDAFITEMSRKEAYNEEESLDMPGLFSVDNIGQFNHGDGIALLPEGKALLVFRPKSNSNALFVTSRCNSNCIMCPQPPQKEDGYDLTDFCFKTLNIIDPEVDVLGITGGEPTLLDDKLYLLVETIKKRFPLAALHILTNGRYFSQTERARALSLIKHPNILLGISLFSDNPYDHDNITRAHGSFSQAVKGVINLARFGIAVEVRIVMIKQVVSRLNKLVEFIYRNLPFVSQVCFMGLEPIGYAKQNFSKIWKDPAEYQDILKEAVYFLSLRGIHVNIYNEQLCILNRELWKFNRRAISDWKDIFLDECSGCMLMKECGGFFSSSINGLHSQGIQKVSNEQ